MRLMLSLATLISGFIVISLVFFQATRKTYPGIGQWTAGVGLLTLGYLLMSLRGFIPEPISVLIGNVAFPLGMVLHLDGIRRFLGVSAMSRLWYALPGIDLVAIAVFYYLHDSPAWRGVVNSIAISAPHWAMAALIFRYPVKHKSMFYPVIGSLIGFAGLVVLARPIATFFLPQWHLLMDSPLQIWAVAVLIVLQLGENLSFIMLNSERVESELVEAQTELRMTVNRLQEALAEQKRVEESLRDSEERYRTFFDTSRDCVFMTTLEGQFSDFNSVTLELLGYAPGDRDELLHTNVADVYANPVERRAHITLISKLGFSKDYPVDLRKRDGTIVHALITTVARRDQLGTIIGFQGTVRDITERKRAEELLQTTLQRFYTILSSMYGGVLLVTDEGRVEFANQAYCDLFDLDDLPSDLRGLESFEMIQRIQGVYAHPAEAVARIQAIVSQQSPVKGEEVAIRGGMTYMRDFVPILIDGKRYGRLWHHQDITERKRVEEALRASEEKYRLLVDKAQEGIFVVQDTVFRFVNPRLEEIVGFSSGELIGNSFGGLCSS